MVYEQALKTFQSIINTPQFRQLYPKTAEQSNRFERLISLHQQLYHTDNPLILASAPGRAEIVGNHTDHNNGLVLACAVNLDTAAAVSKREDLLINLKSEGYVTISLSLEHLEPMKSEAGTSAALIRGVAAGLKQRGYEIGGYDAAMNSQVLSGSGLSSSAAFEVLVCFVFDVLYNGSSIDAVTRAQICQCAENVYFMKPSGLMDQMASSCGGMVRIDFGTTQPRIETLHFSFAEAGYAMVIVNTRSSHDDLTAAYSAIPQEMKSAAQAAGGTLLRDVPYEQFIMLLPKVREKAGDRAVLRALHFYQENNRVRAGAAALQSQNLEGFFEAVNDSGISSWTLLQNIWVHTQVQPIALALALAKELLDKRGACRVLGGGFAGTTLNFVPHDCVEAFTSAMEAVFGQGCCHRLDVRRQGPVQLF